MIMAWTWVVVVRMDGRETRVCKQKEQVAGFPESEQSSWHWFITSRFCYLCYLHPSKNCLGFAWFWGSILCLEDKMLEAISLRANKFDLGNGNLNYTYSTHPFCGLCHFSVPGHLGWWSKELLVYLGVAVSPSSSFCLHSQYAAHIK